MQIPTIASMPQGVKDRMDFRGETFSIVSRNPAGAGNRDRDAECMPVAPPALFL
jgi:hypothetical protein